MPSESRTHKTFLNARVNLIFYFLTIVLFFISRKIFLEKLGADFVGLTNTIQNLLSFLNIVELGIGTAVGYTLYKPLFEHNQPRINEIISVFGYLYQRIGYIIFIAGCLLSGFIPWIFPDTRFKFPIILFAYYVYLSSSLLGYFINYKQILLSADQRNYVVTAYFQTGNILKIIAQIVLLYYTANYYIWIGLELLFGILYSFILNWKINQTYPWLQSDIKSGKKLFKKYPKIITLAKQVFVHKIAGIVQYQTTPLLIYSFVSLHTVAYYGNYSLITEKINNLLSNLMESSAGIGNLIAEGNKKKILSVYWEFIAIRFFLGGVAAFSIYYILPPFISLWIGNSYIMPDHILICATCIFMLNFMRGTTEQFISGHGLYSDIWAPIIEAFIFFIIAIIGGYYYGLVGILSGNIISLLIIVYGWKPYFLFKNGFKTPLNVYWKGFILHIGLSILTYIVFNQINKLINWENSHNSWMSFMLYSAYISFSLALIQFTFLYIGTRGMKDFVQRIKTRFLHITEKH